jgi:hypothetical protein
MACTLHREEIGGSLPAGGRPDPATWPFEPRPLDVNYRRVERPDDLDAQPAGDGPQTPRSGGQASRRWSRFTR